MSVNRGTIAILEIIISIKSHPNRVAFCISSIKNNQNGGYYEEIIPVSQVI